MSRNRLQPAALALALALGAALDAQAAAPEPPMPLGADGLYWGDGPASQYSPGESMKAHAACREVRDLREVVTAAEAKLTGIERQGLENARTLLQLPLDIGTTVKLEMGSAMLKLTERFEHLEDRLSRTRAT